jgi:hypothetical protein
MAVGPDAVTEVETVRITACGAAGSIHPLCTSYSAAEPPGQAWRIVAPALHKKRSQGAFQRV